jgi:bifunctional DNA-binding transcriptional regulator/antitoxin component of YhaV-PrlF toxin-antitoxin module
MIFFLPGRRGPAHFRLFGSQERLVDIIRTAKLRLTSLSVIFYSSSRSLEGIIIAKMRPLRRSRRRTEGRHKTYRVIEDLHSLDTNAEIRYSEIRKDKENPMEDVKPYSTEIRSRGQLTIPKRIREAGAMEEGQSVTIIPIGDSLLVTPKTLKLEDAKRELRKLLKSSGVTLKDLIAGLEEARDHVYGDSYGKKKA